MPVVVQQIQREAGCCACGDCPLRFVAMLGIADAPGFERTQYSATEILAGIVVVSNKVTGLAASCTFCTNNNALDSEQEYDAVTPV